MKIKLLILFIGLFILMQVSSAASFTDDLSHIFPLYNASDYGANPVSIGITDGTPIFEAGLNGDALYCNALNEGLGTTDNTQADKLHLSVPSTWTVWAKPDSTTTGLTSVISKYGSYGMGTNATGFVRAFVSDVDSDDYINGNVTMTNATWHFMVLTYNPTTRVANFYYDNVFIGTKTLSSDLYQVGAADKFKFCVEASGTAWDFVGHIDEAYLWNRTLNVSEISELYNSGAGIFYPTFSSNAAPTTTANISSSDSLNNTNSNLTGGFSYTDDDSDPIADNETRWYKNNEEQTNLKNVTLLYANYTTNADVWKFSARVNDGTDWSAWANSTNLTITYTAVLTDGLVAYYSMDTNCSIDDTGQGETLINTGVDNVAGGKIGNACDFEAGDAGDNLVRNTLALVFRGNSTVSGWVKSESTGAAGNEKAWLTATDSSFNHFRLDYTPSVQKYQAHVESAPAQNVRTTSTYNGDTDWHHWVVKLNSNGTIADFVFDNVSMGGGTGSDVLGSINRFRLGCLVYTSDACLAGYYYDGLLDEIAIWNRTLTQAEITQLYNSGTGYNPLSGGENTAPTTTANISSSDSLNNTNSNITGGFSYTDDDGDPIADNETRWYKGNEEQTNLKNVTLLYANYTTNADVWKFSARVNDGTDWSAWANSTNLTIVNTAPTTLANISSSDSLNNTNSNLTCGWNYSDIDSDAYVNNEIYWYRNNTEMDSLRNVTLVYSNYTLKNEVWKCGVRVGDGTGWSAWANSTNLTILNIAPVTVANISSSNSLNNTLSNLTGGYSYSDTDNDVFASYESIWYKNNLELTSLKNVTLLYANYTTDGEIWKFSARVNDGTDWSAWSNSTNLTIIKYYPTISFISQVPSDINTFNILNTRLNITYNISDYAGINISSVVFYNKVNSSTSDDIFFTSGLQTGGWETEANLTNSSSYFSFLINDNEVYPATYNYDHEYMESTPKSMYNLPGQNAYIKMRFFNVSTNTAFNFFEIYAQNATANTNLLRIYYCNSSYLTGSPATSTNCLNFYSLPASAVFNHSHGANSKHLVIPFAINNATGFAGSVKVTSTSFFLVRGSTTGSWNIFYINTTNYNDTTRLTTNSGNAWTNMTSQTVDSHLHQYTGSETFWYYVCAGNGLGDSNCSTVRSDKVDLGNLPPIAPSVTQPASIKYPYTNYVMDINYTAAESPNLFPISYYNISLINTNLSFVQTIKSNNSNLLYYNWSTASAPASGEYVISVLACDNYTLCSYGYSDNFSINYIPTTSANISSTDSLNNTNSNLTGGYSYIDTDNDVFASYESRWYKNNVELTSLKNVTLLYSNYTLKGEKWKFSVRANDGQDWGLWSNSSNITILNTAAVIGGINYTLSSGTLSASYLQKITYLNFTVTDTDSDNYTLPLLFIYKPDGTLSYTYNMDNSSANVFYKNLSVTFTSVGVWSFTAQVNDGTDNSTFTTQIDVAQVDLPTIYDGFFSYDSETILSQENITNLTTFGFDLIGYTINYSRFNTDFVTLKDRINFSKSTAKSFITIYFDTDYAESVTECNNLANLSDLLSASYFDGMQFAVISQDLTQPNLVNFTNTIAQCIRSELSNKLPIYSKELQNASLDSNYVSAWTMPKIYFNSSMAEYINQELNKIRNNQSLTRVYYQGNASFKNTAKSYHENVLAQLRSGIDVLHTNISNLNTGFLLNKDFIVYNNNSVLQTYIINHTGISNKDMWDFAHKYYYDNVNVVNISVDAYSATLVYVDTFDRLVMTTANKSTLYKGALSNVNVMNYSSNGTLGSLSIVSAYDAKVELWDPSYVFNNLFFITYEQLEYTQIIDFSPYELIIIAKGTNTPTIVNTTLKTSVNLNILNKTYGYISVADYDNNNASGDNITDCNLVNPWETSKTQEAYNWTDLYHTNVFIDGFDIGYASTPTCFEERIKRVADNIKINKGKKVVFNTYTIYQTVSNYGDLIMRESCFSRWSGAVGSPIYAYENISLMIENAGYMRTMNKPLLCMAFGAADDYEKFIWDFYSFAVLYGADGNNLFRYGQPNFQVQQELRVPLLGAMLERDYTINTPTDYSRRYEYGILHVNPFRNATFDNGKYYWFDNGKTVKTMNLTVYAQVYAATCAGGTGITMQFFNGSAYIGNNYTIDPCTDIGVPQWTAAFVTKNVTAEYQEHGHYYLTFRPVSRAEATGTNILNLAGTTTGVHSWWDSSASNPPTSVIGWTAYGRSGVLGDFNTTNFYATLTLDHSTSVPVDTNVNTINIITEDYGRSYNITYNSSIPYNISIWSYPIILNKTISMIYNVSYLHTNASKIALAYAESGDCDTATPTFSSTIIDTILHKVCYKSGVGQTTFRFATPKLSTQRYALDTNADPVVSNAEFVPSSGYTTTDLFAYCNASDGDTATITYNWVIYKDNTINSSGGVNVSQSTYYNVAIINHTQTTKGEVWNISCYAADEYVNSTWKSSVITILNTAPSVPSLITPGNNTRQIGNSVLMQWSNCSDNDNDSLSYAILSDTSNPPTTVRQNISSLSYALSTTDGGVYYWNTICGDGENSTSSNILSFTENSLPTIAVNISSDDFNWTSANITCGWSYTDAESDVQASFETRWNKNGAEQLSLKNVTLLYANYTTKADVWNCSVRVNDGYEWTAWSASSGLSISNTPPVPYSLIIYSQDGFNLTTSNLSGNYSYSDIDTDVIISYESNWYKSNIAQDSLKNVTLLFSNYTIKNEVWKFSIRVNDGSDWSVWVNSSNLTILNTMPSILANITVAGGIDVLSASNTDNKIAWYKNNGSLEYWPVYNISNGADGAASVYSADIDSDGDMDVLSASYYDDKISWYQNNGSLSNWPNYTIATSADVASSVFAIDLDGDGDLDVLSASQWDDKVAWYKNNGSLSGWPAYTIYISTITDTAVSVYPADIDRDGDMDVISGFLFGNKVSWSKNNGSLSNWPTYTITKKTNGVYSVFAEDIDKDGYMDVLSASANDNKIAWYKNNGSLSNWTYYNISTTARGAQSVFSIDIDDDGNMDVLSASNTDNKIAWYKNNGSLAYWPVYNISTAASGANNVYSTDIDGDGDLDVVSSSTTDNKIAWYQNNGSLEYWPVYNISTTASGAISVYAADIDRAATNYTDSNLKCGSSFSDIDYDYMLNREIKWYNSSYEIISAVNATILYADNTTKGQAYKCSVRVNDGTDWSVWANSSGLTILNTVPVVTTANISSSDGLNNTNSNLTGGYGYYDADGDLIAGFETQGYKNNIEQTSLKNVTLLYSNYTTKGDVWKFSLRLTDGTDWSAWFNSSNLTIVNTAPAFLAMTPANQTRQIGNSVILSTSCSDIDSDILNYTFYADMSNPPTTIRQNTSDAAYTLATVDGSVYYWQTICGDGQFTNISNILSFTENNKTDIPIVNISSNDFLNNTNSNLTCGWYSIDSDGDAELSNGTLWYRNFEQINVSPGGSILLSNYTHKGEVWKCSVAVNDGYELSTWFNSSNLTIVNTLPVISVNISSVDGQNNTNSNLTGGYSYYDLDGDAMVALESRWYRNGSEVDTLKNLTTLLSNNTLKYEDWKFSARVNDGEAWTSWYNSSNLTIKNSVPILSTVYINFTTMFNHTGNMTALYTYTDYDNDAITATEIRWFNNSLFVPEWTNATLVPALNTSLNQTWYISMQLYDGENNSYWMNSSSYIIGQANVVPILNNVNLTSNDLNLSSGNLTIKYSFTDPDILDVHVIETKWFKNAAYQSTLDNITILRAGNLTETDIWKASLRVSDGIAYSNWMNTSNVTITQDYPNLWFVTANNSEAPLGVYNFIFYINDSSAFKNCSISYADGSGYVRIGNLLNPNSGLQTVPMQVADKGAYIMNLICADINGYLNSTRISFNGVQPGGSGGGSGIPTDNDIDNPLMLSNESSINGVVVLGPIVSYTNVYPLTKFYITIGNETHIITVLDIYKNESSALFSIHSDDPFNVTLWSGQNVYFDLNKNNIDDLNIELLGVSNSTIDVKISNKEYPATNTTAMDWIMKNRGTLIIVLSLVLLYLYFFSKQKRKKVV